MFKLPKNDAKYHWTNHVGQKMLYYGLSPDRVKRVIRSPYRSEKGIAPDTIAVMQPGKISPATLGKSAFWKEEIWVMYAQKNLKPKSHNLKHKDSRFMIQDSRKVIIPARRYPGKSPIRETIPIPADILEELKSIKY